MRISLIITILLLFGIIIISMQNSMPLDVTLLLWTLHMSLTALIFYAAAAGAAVVAVLTLPGLAKKHFSVKSLNKEIVKLQSRVKELEV